MALHIYFSFLKKLAQYCRHLIKVCQIEFNLLNLIVASIECRLFEHKTLFVRFYILAPRTVGIQCTSEPMNGYLI